jgi:hypothetical protein
MAYYGMMDGTWGTGWLEGALYMLVFFALISFVFSVVFWWTHNQMVVKERRK